MFQRIKICIISLTLSGCIVVNDYSAQNQDGIQKSSDCAQKSVSHSECFSGSHLESTLISLSKPNDPSRDTLCDDPRFGELYTADPYGVVPKPYEAVVSQMVGPKLQQTFINCLMIFVEIKSKDKPEETFRFDDCEGLYGEIYSKIKRCETFRVLYPQVGDNLYVIRGFDRQKKCVYYHEWRKPILDDGELDAKSLQVRRKTLPTIRDIQVPKMREPVFK